MLADKKKRKKFSLNPQGNIWHQDKSKFGQKLLEKMGWKEGQGLGVQNQGISERIKVPFRLNNCAGFGFKEQEDSLIQQKEYVTLLSSMNNSKPEEPLDNSNVSSLEDKSKNSRARVHYHKFTRGKDLSRYSSKDLVGIFGKQEIVDEVCSNELTFESLKKEDYDCDNRLEQDDTVYLKKKTKKKRKIKELEIAETSVNGELDHNSLEKETNRGALGKQEIMDEVCSNELTFESLKKEDDDCDNRLEQDDTVYLKKKTKKKKKIKELEIAETSVNGELENNSLEKETNRGAFGKQEIVDEVCSNELTFESLKKEDDDCDNRLEQDDTVYLKKKTKKRKKIKELEIAETSVNGELDHNSLEKETNRGALGKQEIMDEVCSNELTFESLKKEDDDCDNRLEQDDTVYLKKKTKKKKKIKELEIAETSVNGELENNSLEKETNRGAFSNRESYKYSNKRNMKPDVNGFRGSNLPKIAGYACN